MFVELTLSGELVQEEHEGHLSLELDLSLNQINEQMSSSKPQTSPLYSKKTEHHLSKSQTMTKPMPRPDQQTQTKINSGTLTLFSTRTVVHTSSAKWNFSPSPSYFSRVSSSRTSTLSDVTVAYQTIETSDSNSHWPITLNSRLPTSQSREHAYRTPTVFHTTILSVTNTNHATIWVSTPTASFQACRCVSDPVSGTSIPSGKDRCGNERSVNATTWTINKSGRIIGPTVVAIAVTSHKWKNTTTQLTPMKLKTVASMSLDVSSVADESRTPRLLAVKNQAHSIRPREYKYGTLVFFILSIAICTMLNR